MYAMRFVLGGANNRPLVVVAPSRGFIRHWLNEQDFKPERWVEFDDTGAITDSQGITDNLRVRPTKADVILWRW